MFHSKNSGYKRVGKFGRGKARMGHLAQLQHMANAPDWCEGAMSQSIDTSLSATAQRLPLTGES